MSGTRITIKLGVAGVLIVLVSLSADAIGLGSNPGFGPYQKSGVVAGLLFLAFAVRKWRVPESQESQADVIAPAASEAESTEQAGE